MRRLGPGEIQKLNILFMDISEDGEMDVLFWDYDEMDNIFDSSHFRLLLRIYVLIHIIRSCFDHMHTNPYL